MVVRRVFCDIRWKVKNIAGCHRVITICYGRYTKPVTRMKIRKAVILGSHSGAGDRASSGVTGLFSDSSRGSQERSAVQEGCT
jgi:hypothetical protein